MLNTRSENENSVFYSELACFVITLTLHFEYVRIHVIYRVNPVEYVFFKFVWLRHMNT